MVTEPFIDKPCYIPDLPERDYHRDMVIGGSLSNSMAKDLLPPSCPALFKWKQDNPEPPTPAMEFGTAVHTLTFGVGPDVTVVQARDWKTNAAKEARDEARLLGRIPLLPDDYDRAKACAAAVHADPVSRVFLDLEGDAEGSCFWRDAPTGVMRRARIDYLTRRVLVDLKTTSGTADPYSFGRDTAAKFRYYMQAATYLEGAKTLGMCDTDAGFVFAVVSSAPPHLVSVVELTPDFLAIGERHNRRAVDLYAQCVEQNEWPGFASDVTLVAPPAWLTYQEQ